MNRSCASSRLRAEVTSTARVAFCAWLLVEDGGGDLVGHLAEQRRAVVGLELAGVDHPVQRDLDVDLVVGGVDAGGVVDGVGVHPPAGQRVLDAAALGEPEVAALADDPDPQLLAVHPDGVVGLVPDVERALGRGLHVGADAAVEQQVDRRQQDRPDQLDRAERGHAVGQAERGPHRLGDRDRLRRPRPHAAAGADPRAVVVRPRGALQPEQPLALGEGRRRVGGGVDEDVPVVEGGHQPDVLGQQHPVAEDVAGHVADADDGEVLLLRRRCRARGSAGSPTPRRRGR